MSKTTRGRASKVDLLPADIKTRLAMMLRDKQYSQTQILAEINDLIRECGLDERYCLSKTGLNRYANKMEKFGEKIRQSREIAEIWTKQLGETPQSDIGKLLMEAVKTMA
ncbi:Mu-like phage gp27, partial [Pasteurella multocida subsp. gallicida str. Anand1_poultry]